MGIKKTVLFADDGHAYGVEFTNGTDSFRVTETDFNEATYAHAVAHGIAQKIGDAAALSKGATDAEKWAAMIAMRDQITGPDGEWNRRAEGAGSILVRAVAEWSGRPIADVKKELDAADAKLRAAIAKMDEIKPIIARIEAERPVPVEAKTAAAAYLAKFKPAAE